MLIDQLPEITTANDADEMPIEQGTTTRKIKILNLLKGVVKKAGDTMNGMLRIKQSSTSWSTGFSLQDPDYGPENLPSSSITRYLISLLGNDGGPWGYIRAGINENDDHTIDIAARNVTASGSGTTNVLTLGKKKDGTNEVSFSDSKAWRAALGLGTSGAFPLTIGQGGTGVAGTNTTVVIANIVTPGASVTITSARFAWWGKLAQFDITFNPTADLSAGHVLAVINSGKRPIYDLTFIDSVGQRVAIYGSTGNISTWVNKTAGSAFVVRAVYLLP